MGVLDGSFYGQALMERELCMSSRRAEGREFQEWAAIFLGYESSTRRTDRQGNQGPDISAELCFGEKTTECGSLQELESTHLLMGWGSYRAEGSLLKVFVFWSVAGHS